MSKKKKQGKGGGARKYGNQKKDCERYFMQGRRKKNALNRIRKRTMHINEKSKERFIAACPVGRKREQ